MNVHEILEQINERLLRQLAEVNGWPLSQTEDAALAIDELSHYIISSAAIERTWLTLTDEEKEMLLYFLFRVGRDIVTYRQMEEYARLASPLAAYSGLTGLRRRGLVYTLRRLWGELAYCLPDDMGTAFRTWLLSHAWRERDTGIGTLIDGWDTVSVPLSSVLFRLLQIHRHQPIALTKKGTMTMKTRRLWHRVIPYPEEAFGSVVSEAAGEEGPRDRFLLGLLLSLGLLRKQTADGVMQYTVDEARAADIFRGREAAVQRRLYREVKEKLSLLHPCYSIILDWMEASRESVFSLQALREAEYDLLQGTVFAGKDKHWETFAEEVAPLLVLFGFALKKGEGEEAIYSWVPDLFTAEQEQETGMYTGSGYVQPTFEVLLLPHAPYEVRWELGAYAELEEQQEVWRFRLTQESVQTTENEKENNRLLGLLEQIHPDVPANVREQLSQWLRGGSYVMLARVTVLRCPDTETATWLAADREMADCLLERLNERDFLVEEEKREKLEQALVRRNIRISEQKAARPETDKAQKAEEMISSSGGLENGYKVESIFPALTDVLPELKEVPSIWYKNFQRYHHSTLRKLMESARSLGVPLSAEIDGQPVENIRILNIKAGEGQYCLTLDVSGTREDVQLEDIGRVRLLFPALPGQD
ncbi:hypothetical protein [Aneurinibacillus danicus]|uniref:Helicase XPB/Ssl2 N-terminal domain-containing protein n=1 Tax=Aneurinibacillus danicus TaxID=267746 RepID=A0A511V851_9BACL|nr:hypothetical protein [Aneurinibacillus danicus]GEN34999.1 hypothetical protein ADA01nite_24590 [Aneurinibacillus danicus]